MSAAADNSIDSDVYVFVFQSTMMVKRCPNQVADELSDMNLNHLRPPHGGLSSSYTPLKDSGYNSINADYTKKLERSNGSKVERKYELCVTFRECDVTFSIFLLPCHNTSLVNHTSCVYIFTFTRHSICLQ